MISIGNVWDRTTAVMSGRATILLSIAALLLFLPALVDALLDIPVNPGAGLRIAGGIVSLVAAVLSIWGTLSLIAVASDPAVDRTRAMTNARQRILPALGIALLAGLVALVLAAPAILLVASSGFDIERARQGLEQTDLDAGKLGLAFLYLLFYLVVAIGIGARLVPLFAVVLNERLGLGAFRRSFALTRGSTWKLIGVLLLFAIVLMVVLLAASAIVGLIARLIVGGDNPGIVAFCVAVVAGAVTAGFSIVQSVFSAQFYVAASERTGPATPSA